MTIVPRSRRLASAAAAAALAASAAWFPAQALNASDTMTAWRGATSDARTTLVTGLLKRHGLEGSSSRVMQCIDAAAAVSGHADLPILQVAEACEKQLGDPV